MSFPGMPWTGLLYIQPQRTRQFAWFVYGWIEREHVLNVTTCADWWARAIGISADRLWQASANFELELDI
jgi:hypothetical protein